MCKCLCYDDAQQKPHPEHTTNIEQSYVTRNSKIVPFEGWKSIFNKKIPATMHDQKKTCLSMINKQFIFMLRRLTSCCKKILRRKLLFFIRSASLVKRGWMEAHQQRKRKQICLQIRPLKICAKLNCITTPELLERRNDGWLRGASRFSRKLRKSSLLGRIMAVDRSTQWRLKVVNVGGKWRKYSKHVFGF